MESRLELCVVKHGVSLYFAGVVDPNKYGMDENGLRIVSGARARRAGG